MLDSVLELQAAQWEQAPDLIENDRRLTVLMGIHAELSATVDLVGLASIESARSSRL